MSQDISGPSGFTKSMSMRDKSSVDAMLREGKDLVRMKQQLGRTVQAGEQILSRLVAVRTDVMSAFPSRREGLPVSW